MTNIKKENNIGKKIYMTKEVKYQVIKDIFTKTEVFNKSALDFRILVFNQKIKRLFTVHKTIKEWVINLNKTIELINTYIGVSNIEKDLLGEVFTPFELINEMLDTLPTEVWSNPNLKWLDPANGIGNFPAVVIQRLFKGLENVITDDEERYKHIIENMIYICDISPKNMFIYLMLFNPNNRFSMNYHTGSFLDDEFKDRMGEWIINKFDIIVGNPPYQDSSKVSRNSTFWSKFIKKSDNIIKEGGFINFITPSSWMGPTSAQRRELKEVFSKNNLIHLNLDCRKYFKVSSTFSYYLIKKEKDKYDKTIVVCGGEQYNLNLDLPFLPNEINPLTISIITKLINSKYKMDFSLKDRNDKYDDNGIFKVYYSNKFKSSNTEGKNA